MIYTNSHIPTHITENAKHTCTCTVLPITLHYLWYFKMNGTTVYAVAYKYLVTFSEIHAWTLMSQIAAE